MKSLCALTIFLVGCGHAQTTMDRELALKLADKTPIVVTAPAPIINVNNYNGRTESRDELLARAQEIQRAKLQEREVTNEHQENCVMVPQSDINGNSLGSIRKCFGWN